MEYDYDRKKQVKKTPGNLLIYDPDKPVYEKQYLCIYLRELLDEAEKASEIIEIENSATGGHE